MRALLINIFFLAALGLNTAAATAVTEEKKGSDPYIQTLKRGALTVKIEVTPAEIELNRHAVFSISISSPSNCTVELPDLSDRFKGFVPGYTFDRKSSGEDGSVTIERVVRLTPKAEDSFRIAPIPVTFYPEGVNGRRDWFPTPLIRLPPAPTPDEGGRIEELFSPVWIMPSAAEVTLYTFAAAAAVLTIILAASLLKKLTRRLRLMRMSPRERALEELRTLLQKDLIGRNKVKEFYLELTMIVRRFIERGYRIKAPEQTTEEFLKSAEEDNRFEPAILEKLRKFLQSADLVKFAGFQPDRETTDSAVGCARDFISTDSSTNPETGTRQEVTDA